MTTMRAKFKVYKVESFPTENPTSQTVTFTAVCKDTGYPSDGSDDDNTYARWTPMAECKMTINNPNLIGKLIEGEKYYVDFTPVEPNQQAGG